MIPFVSAIVLMLALWTSPAEAALPRLFTQESMAAIQARYTGQPFILIMWSVAYCEHCISELTLLGKIAHESVTRKGGARKTQRLPLVLVATDGPESSASIQDTLGRLGLSQMDSWVFDDPVPERLRHLIDPSWFGEVPRAYLYDAQHRRESVSGVLEEPRLRAWIDKNLNQVRPSISNNKGSH